MKYFLTAFLFMIIHSRIAKAQIVIQHWFGDVTQGIILYNDNRFFLYGYATMIFGDYTQEDNKLNFVPDNLDKILDIYGSHNPNFTNQRFSFYNMDDDSFYISMNEDTFRRIFNDGFNCSNGPFITRLNNASHSFSLVIKEMNDDSSSHFLAYNNLQQYNDFIIIHYPNSPYKQLMFGHLTNTHLTLTIPNKTTFNLTKSDLDEQNKNEFSDILLEYEQSKMLDIPGFSNVIYANEHTSIPFDLDVKSYKYFEQENLYIESSKYKDVVNNLDFYPDDLHDFTKMRAYFLLELHPLKKVTINIYWDNDNPIFFSDCNESNLNYRYGETYRNEYIPISSDQ